MELFIQFLLILHCVGTAVYLMLSIMIMSFNTRKGNAGYTSTAQKDAQKMRTIGRTMFRMAVVWEIDAFARLVNLVRSNTEDVQMDEEELVEKHMEMARHELQQMNIEKQAEWLREFNSIAKKG